MTDRAKQLLQALDEVLIEAKVELGQTGEVCSYQKVKDARLLLESLKIELESNQVKEN